MTFYNLHVFRMVVNPGRNSRDELTKVNENKQKPTPTAA